MPRLRLALPLLLAAVSAAQTTHYASPDGRFSIDYPADWKLDRDATSNQIDIHKGPISFSAAVMEIDKGAQASDYLEASDSALQKQCPTYKHRDTHPATLSGLSALASVSTCSDPRSPALAETTAALTPAGLLATITAVAPAEHYADSIALFDPIKASFHTPAIPGSSPPTGPAAAPSASSSVSEIKKACAAGRYTQEECSRRLGIALSASTSEQPAPGTQHIPNSTSYHDPQSRFTVDIPPGWAATPEGDNGALGVQLRHGNDWIDIMPSSAPSAKEAVLAHERDMIQRSHSTRKPPFSPTGLIQIFGHGTELTYDTTTATNPGGTSIDALIAAIAPIHGGPAKLLLDTSITHTSDPSNDPSLGVALSIRLP